MFIWSGLFVLYLTFQNSHKLSILKLKTEYLCMFQLTIYDDLHAIYISNVIQG